MTKYKKMFTLIMLSAIILSGCNSSKFKADTDWEVESFSHESQRGEEVSLESLNGTVWLATFIFTNCETVCPPMTMNMTQVQDELIKAKVEDYKIVAFSVDPEVDTPEIMTDYLAKFNPSDESKWELLTGYDPEYMEQFARDSFKSLVKMDPGSDQVLHGTSYFLVDQNGIVVKSYNGYQDVPKEEIATDMKALIEQGK
jgi:protein SCO1/2